MCDWHIVVASLLLTRISIIVGYDFQRSGLLSAVRDGEVGMMARLQGILICVGLLLYGGIVMP